jgi:hypothetical protein
VAKRGVVIWGSTPPTQFGYGHNTNMQFHMGNKWDAKKFDPADPRNVLVDPVAVVEAYKNLTTKGKDKPVNVHCLTA